jgi:hypothetical protein
MLREAKEEAEYQASHPDQKEPIVSFSTEFDKFQGLAHLEALEILSKECLSKVYLHLNASVVVHCSIAHALVCNCDIVESLLSRKGAFCCVSEGIEIATQNKGKLIWTGQSKTFMCLARYFVDLSV